METGPKTGFFPDQRENRKIVRDLARGRSVLDGFCSTGTFGMYALAGGATSVLAVDVSREAVAAGGKMPPGTVSGTGGILATSSCTQLVDMAKWNEALRDAAADARADAHVLARGGQSPDHPILLGVPETEYLKFTVLRTRGT